ncbi:MAG: sialidase family protein [Anaerolineae bacterium]
MQASLLETATPSCHAATLVEVCPGRLLAAWFGGTAEGASDVGIWLAAWDRGTWGQPTQVATEQGVPCWNPVLFAATADEIWLFYKVGPTIPAWTGALRRSRDGGRSWSPPTWLPAGLLGPAKNKPIRLSNGEVLCATSAETWRSLACWVETSADNGHSWRRWGPIPSPDPPADLGAGPDLYPYGLIQPAAWEYAPGCVGLVLRPTRHIGRVCLSKSQDYGRTWSRAQPLALPNPDAGLDVVRLRDGRLVLACNPSTEERTPLSLYVSCDNGETWRHSLDLETAPGEYSYPAIIQTADGLLHVAYTWRRQRIRHVSLAVGELNGA